MRTNHLCALTTSQWLRLLSCLRSDVVYIHSLLCLVLFQLVAEVSSLVLVFLCSMLCPFYFCNHFDKEERAGCFTLVVFLIVVSVSFSVALPHGCYIS